MKTNNEVQGQNVDQNKKNSAKQVVIEKLDLDQLDKEVAAITSKN